jgi:hypothetical protein
MRDEMSKRYKGISLIEVIIASAVISIAVIGGISYRYTCALDGRRAALQADAARAALLLCESWRGDGGLETYDPVTHLDSDGFTIATDLGPEGPVDFTALGSYKIVFDGSTCYATLSYKQVDTGLRALNVTVAWQQRSQAETGFDDMDRLFVLSTFVPK